MVVLRTVAMLMATAMERHLPVVERHQADTVVMIGILEAVNTEVRRKLATEPAGRTERCKIESRNMVGRSNLNRSSSLILSSITLDRLRIGNSIRSKVHRPRHSAHYHRSNRLNKNHCYDGGDDVRQKSPRQRFLHCGVHDARVSDDHDVGQNRLPETREWLPEPVSPWEVGERIWR